MIGAERDEILPIRHAHKLYQSLPEGKKRMWVIKGAGHNDWPFYADASLWKEMTDFVKIEKKTRVNKDDMGPENTRLGNIKPA